MALWAIAPGVGRYAGAVALVAILAGATFLVGFGFIFIWFTLAALLDELRKCSDLGIDSLTLPLASTMATQTCRDNGMGVLLPSRGLHM